MSNWKEHLRHVLTYEFKQGHNAAVAARNIRSVYGEDAVALRTCRKWFAKFKQKNFCLKDAPRSGRPSKVDIRLIYNEIERNPRQSVEEMARNIGIPKSTVFEHIKKIGMVWKSPSRSPSKSRSRSLSKSKSRSLSRSRSRSRSKSKSRSHSRSKSPIEKGSKSLSRSRSRSRSKSLDVELTTMGNEKKLPPMPSDNREGEAFQD